MRVISATTRLQCETVVACAMRAENTAKAIRAMADRFLADPDEYALALHRAETLETFAEGLRIVAKTELETAPSVLRDD